MNNRPLRSLLLFGAAAAALLTAGLAGGAHAAAPAPQAPPLSAFAPASSLDSSYNWSGYVAQGGDYTAVSASWVVPEVSAEGVRLAADAAWVGIGGVASPDLIQVGTQAIVDRTGDTRYEAWWETLPEASEPFNLEVSPGDSVTASLVYLGNSRWRISFVDNTTGTSADITVAYLSSRSSAEWVEEMPATAGGGGLIPLDNFGTLGFTNARTVKNGVSMAPQRAGAGPLQMLGPTGETLAAPSVLSEQGNFTVMRTDAPADVARRPVRERIIYISF